MRKTYSDGSTESKSYGCCTLDSSTDRQGITTYSKVGNRSIRTRQGMGESTQIVGTKCLGAASEPIAGGSPCQHQSLRSPDA
ncbi:MAG: hypothetical protein R3F19_18650 [Verrucomicrobiales bacterium]